MLPPMTDLGRWIRYYRRTYYKRIADRLECALHVLGYDPEITIDGDYICFARFRIYCPSAVQLMNTHGE